MKTGFILNTLTVLNTVRSLILFFFFLDNYKKSRITFQISSYLTNWLFKKVCSSIFIKFKFLYHSGKNLIKN